MSDPPADAPRPRDGHDDAGARGAVTRLLSNLADGQPEAMGELLPLVYEELRRLARGRLAKLPPGQTLQPTALVHEAYMRLVGDQGARFESRAHFFGAAANAMRNILVDQARRKSRLKHGGDRDREAFDEQVIATALDDDLDVIALDEALTRLEASDPEKAQIVSLRYFAGLSIDQTAEALDLSPATVDRHWSFARAWLRREITSS